MNSNSLVTKQKQNKQKNVSVKIEFQNSIVRLSFCVYNGHEKCLDKFLKIMLMLEQLKY